MVSYWEIWVNIWSVFVTRISFLPSLPLPPLSCDSYRPVEGSPYHERVKELESNKTDCLEATYLMVGWWIYPLCLFYDTCCPSLSFSFGLSEGSTAFDIRRAFVVLDLYYFDSSIYCGSGWKGPLPGASDCLGPQFLQMKMFVLLMFFSLILFWQCIIFGEYFYFWPSYFFSYLRYFS